VPSTLTKLGIVAAVLVAGGSLAVASWVVASIRSKSTVRQVSDSLNREMHAKLPLGSTKTLAKEFLTTHHIKFVAYEGNLGKGYGEKYGGASSILDAWTEDLNTTLLKCRLHLTITFDDGEKIMGEYSEPVCQAPF
jgi:hypothetical protein